MLRNWRAATGDDTCEFNIKNNKNNGCYLTRQNAEKLQNSHLEEEKEYEIRLE